MKFTIKGLEVKVAEKELKLEEISYDIQASEIKEVYSSMLDIFKEYTKVVSKEEPVTNLVSADGEVLTLVNKAPKNCNIGLLTDVSLDKSSYIKLLKVKKPSLVTEELPNTNTAWFHALLNKMNPADRLVKDCTGRIYLAV